MIVYIYSFHEGETKWASDEPYEEDLVAVGDGQLEVLRVTFHDNVTGTPPGHAQPHTVDVEIVDEEGNWSPATEAQFTSTHGLEFHE